MNGSDQFDGGPGDGGTNAPPPSDEVRAGEYVLGVLDAQERRHLEARIATDPLFAGLAEAWERRLAPWVLRVDEVSPSAHVWPRIRNRIGVSPVAGGRRGVWNSAPFWRAATGLAAAAGIAAVVIGLQAPPPAPLPTPVAVVQPPVVEEQVAKPVTVLARDDGSTGWLASIDVDAGKVLMVPVPTPPDASGLVNELWIIPAGAAPVSLGFVSNEKAHTITVPPALQQALAVGATLAITLEPQAGMPHAAPSGPIVAKGGINTI
ncbi:anti-sigma factor domain-containing protein [Lysobacter sp. F6437]|uniref:anti-sigma factor domain-containing protein n=1 Tax=Lysobacter sp. F6437 TaxID=3459296 RepID=UPI00403E1415